MELPQDSVGAFMTRDIRGGGAGPLGGLDWAAKDLFDLAGEVTGYGNPDWARTHAPAAATAPGATSRADESGSAAGPGTNSCGPGPGVTNLPSISTISS